MALVVVLGDTAGAQVRKSGDEFVVNSYTTHGQGEPAVATLGENEFVVVWSGANPVQSHLSGVRSQRFYRSGSPIGTECLVSDQATADEDVEILPAIAADANGGFVVAWASYYSRDDSDIVTQLFDPQGNRVTGQVGANSSPYKNWLPAAAIDASGNFVVVWTDGGTLANYKADTRLRLFDPSGQKTGTEINITANEFGAPSARVAMRPGGESLVVKGGGDIRGQRVALSGSLIGSEFTVNTQTESYQGRPDIAAHGDEAFVVVWQSYGDDGSGLGIFGQRLATDGSRVGEAFQVNEYTSNHQALPAVAIDAEGGFVVAWESYDEPLGGPAGQDGSGRGVFGRAFRSDGTPRGSEFQVNTYTSGNQGHLRLQDVDVAVYPDGDFVIVWPSNGQDGDYLGVFGQKFDLDLTLGPLCGDLVANDLRITSSDALAILRASIGLHVCDLCICDSNSSGDVTAADALSTLRVASSPNIGELTCPSCS